MTNPSIFYSECYYKHYIFKLYFFSFSTFSIVGHYHYLTFKNKLKFLLNKEKNVKQDPVFCGLAVCVEGNRVDNLGEMGKRLVVQKIFCDTV